MKNIFLILFTGAIMFPLVIFSQSAADKKVQAGLTFNAGANFLSPSSNKIEANSGGSVLSIGLNLHSALKSSQNLAIATGLEFDFGKNTYSPNSSGVTSYTYVDYLQDDVILTNEEAANADSYETMQLVSRNVSTTKLTIPLMLLFRTNFIGDFRYFGKFGIRNSFLLSHSIADDGFATTLGIPNGTDVSTTLMRSPGEMFIYNGSIGLTAGAEWNFVGSTCLVLEAGYYYGITPYFLDRKEVNRTMYNIGTELTFPPSRNYYSASARQNQLIFKLSILF
jgi:hypothetical protein